jgi:UDP-GlcNAc:undecaprenyl-phosphate GlcNAc-1-phosphate transferase
LTALACFLIAFAVSYFGTLGLLRIPMGRGFIDVPNERSSHEAPKPRIGGVAIVVSFYFALAYLFAVAPETRSFIPLAVGSAMLFLTGVLDDWRGLGVKVRFAMQFVAAITVVSFGVTLDHVYIPAVGNVGLGWIGPPLTVMFIVGCINFYNFIDGIDGLAAGSAFIASGFLALISMMLGHGHLALLYVAVAGSTVGFLQFNFPPSKLFMGDSGSTFLGFLFAYTAVAGNGLRPELPVFIPVLILSSLFVDAGLTLFNRIVKKENIFEAHHTHYYQRLLSLGLNHKQVTLLEYLLVILLGTSAVVYFKAGGYFPLFLSFCWITLFTLAILKIRGLERGDRLFWEKRTLFVIGLDLILIAAAYLGAYFLRMNFRFTELEGMAVLRALPIVLIVRSAVFFKCGLYRSVYKYTSTADIVRILKAVTLGSAIVLTIVVLLYRFVAFPRTLFVIEFFLLTLLILGSRFSFRLFHEIGKEAHGANVRRFGIVGAGDLGERIARELRNDHSHSTAVACFIDDDPSKIGMTLHGAPIVGPTARIREICAQHRLDALALGIARIEPAKLKEISAGAQAAGVPTEGRHSALWREPEPTVELFERLGRGLGRGAGAISGVDTPAKVFYRGKHMVLTGAGGPIGAALALELVALGASVTVQADSPRDARCFNGKARKDVFLFVGALDNVGAWRRLLESARPDVVFHCLSLDVDADSNVDHYLWDTAVKGTTTLMDAVNESGVSSVVMVSFWNGNETSYSAAKAGAVAETILLNGSTPAGLVPKAIRLPKVFTEDALTHVHHGLSGDVVDSTTAYSVLEPEAVALVLDCAAAEPGRAVVVPVCGRTFSVVEASSILTGAAAAGDPLAPTAPRENEVGPNASPKFPAEVPSCPTPNGRGVRLDSPVCPAVDSLSRVFSDEFENAPPAAREEWLTVATAPLYRIASTGEHARSGMNA